MFKRKKTLIGICCLSGLALLALFAKNHKDLITEYELLHHELEEFIVPDITIDDTTYTVKKGMVQNSEDPNKKISLRTTNKVLRLSHYAVLQRLDPLFGLEGTNPDMLEHAIEALDTSTDSFAHYYDEKAQKTIKEYFYPLSFLETLPQLETLRKEVMLFPSEKNIRAHVEQLTKTMREYHDYLRVLKDIYTDFNDTFGPKESNNIGGLSSNPSILAFIDELEHSFLETAQKNESRTVCFDQFSPSCTSLHEVLRSLPTTQTGSGGTYSEIPETIETNYYIFSNVFRGREGFERSTSTPLVVLHESRCFEDHPATYYYLWWRKLEDDMYAFNAEYLNDIYLYDVINLNKQKNASPYFRAIEDAGITHLSQQVTNLYMCQNQSKDMARIKTQYAIYNSLQEMPLTGNIQLEEASSTLQAIHEVEEEIISSPVVYESNINTFINHTTALLKDRGEVALSDAIGSERVLYIEKLIRMHIENSVDVNEILATIITTNKGLNAIFDTDTYMSLNGLFKARAYPLATLLTFNNSVVDDSLSFLEWRPNMIEAVQLTSYNDALSQTFTPKELTTIMSERNERLKDLEKTKDKNLIRGNRRNSQTP